MHALVVFGVVVGAIYLGVAIKVYSGTPRSVRRLLAASVALAWPVALASVLWDMARGR